MHECARATGAATWTAVRVNLSACHVFVAMLCAGHASAQSTTSQEPLGQPVTPSLFDVTFGDTSRPQLELDQGGEPAARLTIDYMAQPLGTKLDTTPPWASSYADMASNRTEWTVSARVERTLKTWRGGPSPSSTDLPLLPSKTVRFGVTFAF